MTEQYPSPIGNVAQEAARLIEDMATMARLSYSRPSDPGGYAGGPARGAAPMDVPGMATSARDPQEPEGAAGSTAESSAPESTATGLAGHESTAQEGQPHDSGATNERSEGACSQCGATGREALGDGTANCRLCPLCRGIGWLRSVRPETVDLLADLAMSVAAGLREVALWSRTYDPAGAAKSATASPPTSSPASDRAPVQDIPVDDEGEG